jgi:putative ABC transport system substrate-binding protein
MRPRAFLFGVAFALVQALSFAWAQQVPKLPSVGVISIAPLTSPHYQAFRQGLRDLGYIEGKNIDIVAKSAAGNPDRLPELARELVQLNVNVMLVGGDQGLRATKKATDAIPIVVEACDPLDALVVSIARPGGKATGLTCISSELAGKRLQLLKELVSPLTRVAILYNPEDRNKEWEYKQSQEAADKLKLVLRAYQVRSSIDIDEAFTRMVEDHTQALVIFADILMLAHQKSLQTSSWRTGFPRCSAFENLLKWAGLSPTVQTFRRCGDEPLRTWTKS